MAMNFSIKLYGVTGDETWVTFLNVETKEQPKQWMHAHSPNKPKKDKQISARNLMAAVFLDRKGVLMMEFMQQGTTVSEVYCETLKNCAGPAIQNKEWNADIQCNAPP
jgi:hypothetical protein